MGFTLPILLLDEPIKSLLGILHLNDRAGAISNWRDLMNAAMIVRPVLGVSPSAYQDTCEIMGPENAATTIACILERAGQINSARGYLRDLTTKARRGEFSLGPVLMALLRMRGQSEKVAG